MFWKSVNSSLPPRTNFLIPSAEYIVGILFGEPQVSDVPEDNQDANAEDGQHQENDYLEHD